MAWKPPKLVNNIKQEAINDWLVSIQYVHAASVNHIGSTHAPHPANHHSHTLPAQRDDMRYFCHWRAGTYTSGAVYDYQLYQI